MPEPRYSGVHVKKGILDPVGTSAKKGLWPSDIHTVRALLGTVLLSSFFFSWLWQALRLYGYPGLVPYYDEAGQLFHIPLFTGVALLVAGARLGWRPMPEEVPLGSLRRRLLMLLLMWSPVILMLVPVTDEFSNWGRLGGWGASALAGTGAALAACRLGWCLSRFAGGLLVLALGLIGILTPFLNYLVLWCPEAYRVVPALVFPAAVFLLAAMPEEGGGRQEGYPFARIPFSFWAGCLFTAFSESAYYNLYGALEPVLPAPSVSVLALVALGSLAALVVLGQAHRSPIWYAFLLVIPVLVVGYTAWPLLHRESPGLSLGGLLFGYSLLNIYMMTAFLHTVSYRSGSERLRLLAIGLGSIAMASWLGSHNSGWIADSIARGDSLNSLFAFQAFAILAGSLIFVVYLEKMGFFRLAKAESVSGERAAEKVPGTPMSLMDWTIEEVEAHFRELGLTRQQAMIAAMLARKTPDATICETLNISPSTLKTHIRNIHRRLGISSRHELAWLVTAAPAGEASSNR